MKNTIVTDSAVNCDYLTVLGTDGPANKRVIRSHGGIEKHAGQPIVDCIVLNSGKIPSSVLKRYEKQRAWPVEDDRAALGAMGVEVFLEDLLATGTVVRHDSALLADLLIRLARESRLRGAGATARGR